MRLISQDGKFDIPYEQVAIELDENEVWCYYSATIKSYCTGKMLAKYSNEEKALKVMQMVRDAYVGLPVVIQNMEIENDVLEKLKEWNLQGIMIQAFENQPSKFEFINNRIFRFPSDEEGE